MGQNSKGYYHKFKCTSLKAPKGKFRLEYNMLNQQKKNFDFDMVHSNYINQPCNVW